MRHYNELPLKKLDINEVGEVENRIMIDGKNLVKVQAIIDKAREGLVEESIFDELDDTVQEVANNTQRQFELLQEVTLDYIEDGYAPMLYKNIVGGDYIFDRRPYSELATSLKGNSSIKEIYLLDCKDAATLSNAFLNAKFTHVEGIIGTKNVTKFNAMFSGVSLKTIDLSRLDTSSAKDLSYMFFSQNGLNNVTNYLSIVGWKTSQVTNLRGMFFGNKITNAQFLSFWDVANLEKVNSMFQWCTSLQTVDLSGWAATKIKEVGYWFITCYNLKKVDVSNCDFSNVTPTSSDYPTDYVFYNERGSTMALTDFSGFPNIRCSYNLSQCYKLTYESAMNCINTLGDLTEGGTLQANGTLLEDGTTVTEGYNAQTLTFHAYTRELLSDEDIAIATIKGWNIAG